MERLEVDLPHEKLSDQAFPAMAEGEEQLICEDSCATKEPVEDLARSQVSSPCISTSSASHQLPVLEGKAGLYFSSLHSSIDILKKRAQDLIENINENRQKDHALMTNFRDSLKIKVSDLTEKLEDRIYQVYSYHSKIIQERLQEFTQKMLQISHLEMELKEACHTVESVYRDLCVHPEATALEEQTYKDADS
ncbi:synaptonemal complex central element protein 2 isoform X1 [Heterocephalus glaber]|uniref:Synaptonemal complex central element protein 2 isoform X1 n=1 Tax=Heterocephalus glaber TaxID=10181 RepID=A0AAX6SAM3_HETGA|nr:synaptonemal complex central element protein 2 isoform X1 [Heterocephalus glaber]